MDPAQAESEPATHRVPEPSEIAEVIGHIPVLAAFFQRARSDMPSGLRASFDKHRLGPRHGAVLIQLIAGQPLSVTELAHRIGSSLSTVSELVGELQRAELAQRQEDPDDRRRTLVSLPDQPREEFAQFLALRAEPLLRALHHLSPGHREGFIAGLRLWADETERSAGRGGGIT